MSVTIARVHKIEGEIGKDEDWLQLYLANHPELLPVRDLEGISSRLRLIARELVNIDLLFADDRGLLTLVETKLVENPEAKRQVIAQLLDYASQLRKLDVGELCRLIASMKGSKSISVLNDLERLASALSKYVSLKSNPGESEETAEAVLAHYVLKGEIAESPRVSDRDKQLEQAFIDKLDSMLREGSFRLVVVAYEISQDLLDLLNYANSIMGRGHQLVAVELSIYKTSDGAYFVPHFVGAPGLLAPEYYREENAATRIIMYQSKEEFLSKLPEEFADDVGKLINEVDARQGQLFYEQGKYRLKGRDTTSLLLGAKSPIGNLTLLALYPTGEITLYANMGKDQKLHGDMKEKLLALYGSKPFLREAYEKIKVQMQEKPPRYGPEPGFNLRDCGPKGERWPHLLKLLQEFYTIINP